MTVLLLYILLMVFLNAYKTLSSPLFQDGAWNFCINLFRLLWVNQIFVLEVLSLFLARLFHHTSDEDGLTALIFYALFALEIFKSKTVQSYIKSGSIVASADFYELSVPTMFPPQQWCDLRYVSHFLRFIITKQRQTKLSMQVFGAFWYGFCFNYLLYICCRICLHSPIDGYAKVFGVVLFAGCRRNGPNCIPQLSREQAINSYPHFQQTNTTTVYYLVFSYFKKSDKFCSVGSSLQNKNIWNQRWWRPCSAWWNEVYTGYAEHSHVWWRLDRSKGGRIWNISFDYAKFQSIMLAQTICNIWGK